MEAYNVILNDKVTIIESKNKSLRMQVYKANDLPYNSDTALLEATLYKELKSFIPDESYIFELIDNKNNVLADCSNIDSFKAAIHFFFNSILDTELFIISIPQSSALCPIERKAYNYHKVSC